MPFSPLGQLASARSSRHPVSHTPSAIRIHAPRRYPCEPNGITHTPSQLYAAKSLRIWLAPSPDVPAVFEATYNTVVLEAGGDLREDADVCDVAVDLGEVHAVADDKAVGYGKGY